jgi:hypothetical protein
MRKRRRPEESAYGEKSSQASGAIRTSREFLREAFVLFYLGIAKMYDPANNHYRGHCEL